MCTVDDIVKTSDGTPTGSPIGGVAPVFAPLLPVIPGDPNAIQDEIDRALEDLSRTYFGTKFVRACSYYVAHNLAISYPALAQGLVKTASGGTAGAVTSKRAGDLAVGFGSVAAASGVTGLNQNDVGFAETSFGRRYLQIRRACRASPRFVFGV